jgi:hypothetical protein
VAGELGSSVLYNENIVKCTPFPQVLRINFGYRREKYVKGKWMPLTYLQGSKDKDKHVTLFKVNFFIEDDGTPNKEQFWQSKMIPDTCTLLELRTNHMPLLKYVHESHAHESHAHESHVHESHVPTNFSFTSLITSDHGAVWLQALAGRLHKQHEARG